MLRRNKRALIIFAEEWTLKKIARATILFMEKVRLFGKFWIYYMLSSWVSLKYPPPKKTQTNKQRKKNPNKQKLPKYPPPEKKRIKPNKQTKEKKPNKQTKSPKNQKPKTWHAFVHVKVISLYPYKIQCARTHARTHTHTRARAHVCLCVCYLHNAEKRLGCHLILLLRDHVISVWKQIA